MKTLQSVLLNPIIIINSFIFTEGIKITQMTVQTRVYFFTIRFFSDSLYQNTNPCPGWIRISDCDWNMFEVSTFIYVCRRENLDHSSWGNTFPAFQVNAKRNVQVCYVIISVVILDIIIITMAIPIVISILTAHIVIIPIRASRNGSVMLIILSLFQQGDGRLGQRRRGGA